MKKFVIGMGCLLIVIAGSLFAYSKYQQDQVLKKNMFIYQETIKLLPNTYVGEGGYLVVDDMQVKGVITNMHFKLAFGKNPLPSYNHHIIRVDYAFENALKRLEKGEVLKLQFPSGEIQYYRITDHGTITYRNISNAGLIICTYGDTCYYVNAQRIMNS